MRNLLFVALGVLASCSSPRTDKIIVPKLESNFYNEALIRINDQLESDGSNEKLIDQKLYYCQQLGWPTTCISALDKYKSQHGMTNQLIEQYISYYSRHERHQLLIDIIENWGEVYDLKDQFHQPLIKALVRLGKKDRAYIELRRYMIGKSESVDLEFASQQYLLLKDTTLSSYYLGKLSQIDPFNDLMINYGQILISLNFVDQGFNILEKVSNQKYKNEEYDLMIARLYARQENFKAAIASIRPYSEKDTISYLIVDWFMKLDQWDSAINYVNFVIKKDSLNEKARWKKARMYENRGWLATSLTFYNDLYLLNPEDTITRNRIDLIQRKIAYLQRKKFEDNKIQILEIEPLKIDQ